MYPPFRSGLTVKELPSEHLNFKPEYVLPNGEDLQDPAEADEADKDIEAIIKSVDANRTLKRIG